MNKQKFLGSLALLSLLFGIYCIPVSAANLGEKMYVSKKASETQKQERAQHRNVSMILLSQLTGKTVAEIETQYPQKTAWQAAKAMGKLDDLKKAYLEHSKKAIDSLVENKKISQEDGSKMYSDIEKRVSAIDGESIVIPGRPSFNPEFSS